MKPDGEGSGSDAASLSSPKDKGKITNTGIKYSVVFLFLECPICLDVFKTPIKTKCGHVFCKGCIEEALRHDPYCPTCKKPLRSITGKQPVGGTMTTSVRCLLSCCEIYTMFCFRADIKIPSSWL